MFGVARNRQIAERNHFPFMREDISIFYKLIQRASQACILQYSRISRAHKKKRQARSRECVLTSNTIVPVHRSAHRCNYRLCLCATSAPDLIEQLRKNIARL